ncbi:MAG: Protein UmuC [Candidatus Omnitrophica bacterium]|nr:Protein UmuC [Candidatus Omnitrophota bacterium]
MWPSSASTSDGWPSPLTSLPRAIAHVDCDAFFASVEQALRPELKGLPVVTGKERGIAAAMSYEAKRRGVVRGMRLSDVRRVCPEAVVLPNDYETYGLFSKRLFGILRRYTPDIEEYSIDEAFVDLTGTRRTHQASYEDIALRMKAAVESELGITVSVGLSLTRSLAKICSKERKPAGFVCVKGYELKAYLAHVPADRVCGLGPNSVALLAKYGVRTVLDYASRPEEWVRRLLGKTGVELWWELRGRAVYAVETALKAPASVSKTKTFTPPSGDREFVRAQLLRNVESACIKLRRHGLALKAIGVHLTTDEFRTSGLSAELSRATSSTIRAVEAASELFVRVYDPARRYRRTGVVLSELEPDSAGQADLFEDAVRLAKLRGVSAVVDEVNRLYGKHALHLAATDGLRSYAQHLGERGDHARRKIDLLRGETHRQRLGLPVWEVRLTR